MTSLSSWNTISCLCTREKLAVLTAIPTLHVCVLLPRLLSSTSLRPLFLLSVSLLGLMLLERWKPKLPIITGKSSGVGWGEGRGPAECVVTGCQTWFPGVSHELPLGQSLSISTRHLRFPLRDEATVYLVRSVIRLLIWTEDLLIANSCLCLFTVTDRLSGKWLCRHLCLFLLLKPWQKDYSATWKYHNLKQPPWASAAVAAAAVQFLCFCKSCV